MKKPNRQRYPLFLQLTNSQITSHDPHMLQLNESLSLFPTATPALAAKAGVSASTIRNWRRLKTKRPQHVTLASVALALGYTLTLRPPRSK